MFSGLSSWMHKLELKLNYKNEITNLYQFAGKRAGNQIYGMASIVPGYEK